MQIDRESEKLETSDFEKLQILQYRVAEHQLAKIWTNMLENNLEPILIKGWAAARYYPKPFKRHLGDFDVAVAPENYSKALEVVEREGLNKVDLHEGLRHLDTVTWTDLLENSLEINCEGVKIRVLRPEDHLRVLVVHWLTDGGEYFEKLRDILYLIENRPKDFDWKRCLDKVSKNRQRWIIITIGLTHKYFGLNLDDTPFIIEAKKIPKWMIEFLEKEWQSGYHLIPIHLLIGHKKQLWKQLKKRLPPNPIQATIEMEGSLDSKFRFQYQIGSLIKRIFPSLKRISKRILGR